MYELIKNIKKHEHFKINNNKKQGFLTRIVSNKV